MFLPDGPYQTQPPSGVADITPADPETTSADIALMQRVLSAASRNPTLIPADFMAYLLDWIQTQRLQIPIGQVFGFSQFTAQPADDVLTVESTLSTSYADLSTVGPELTGLSDGKYLFLFTFGGANGGGGSANQYMNVSVNGVTPANDNDAARCTASATGVTAVGWSTQVLKSGGDNSAKAVYRVDTGATGTPNFNIRRLIGLKIANS